MHSSGSLAQVTYNVWATRIDQIQVLFRCLVAKPCTNHCIFLNSLTIGSYKTFLGFTIYRNWASQTSRQQHHQCQVQSQWHHSFWPQQRKHPCPFRINNLRPQGMKGQYTLTECQNQGKCLNSYVTPVRQGSDGPWHLGIDWFTTKTWQSSETVRYGPLGSLFGLSQAQKPASQEQSPASYHEHNDTAWWNWNTMMVTRMLRRNLCRSEDNIWNS